MDLIPVSEVIKPRSFEAKIPAETFMGILAGFNFPPETATWPVSECNVSINRETSEVTMTLTRVAPVDPAPEEVAS